jgi:hypothetical protein
MRIFLLICFLCFSAQAFALSFATRKVADAVSMGASFTTNGIDISKADIVSFQAVWSGGGTPVGTFTLEVSNDDVQTVSGSNEAANVTNWTTYSNSSIAISGDGDLGYNASGVGYRWARLRYVRSSGTGTINIQAIAKSENYK